MSENDETWRLKDFGGAVLFLLLQGFLWRAALFLTRGDVRELQYGGLVLLFVTIAVVVWRVARQKRAAPIALGGCVLQLGFGGVALLMAP
ncbi:hypothetical protein [Mycobacterium sp. SMC-4]|uniref:hypothetical protein n=1 Tax=Mycobacterium sp. SMC-4 TaxID=2857059 RepID=UPI0021B23D31|nr:hypothetical protein [Mycobacterium sp. SMC-4]UXA17312.1 hypothetical protein KXD98_21620 [Mycobacterium sp. SMC-4]